MKERARLVNFLRTIICYPDLAQNVKSICVRQDQIFQELKQQGVPPLPAHLGVDDKKVLMKAAAPYLQLDNEKKHWERWIKAGMHSALLALILCLCHNVTSLHIPLDCGRHFVGQRNWMLLRIAMGLATRTTSDKACGGLSSLTQLGFDAMYPYANPEKQANIKSFIPFLKLLSLKEITLDGVFTSGAFEQPARMNRLTSIRLRDCQIERGCFERLVKACNALKSLSIGCTNQYIDTTIDYTPFIQSLATHAPNLETLELLFECGFEWGMASPHLLNDELVISRLTNLKELRVPAGFLFPVEPALSNSALKQPRLPKGFPPSLRKLVLYNFSNESLVDVLVPHGGFIEPFPLPEQVELYAPLTEDWMRRIQVMQKEYAPTGVIISVIPCGSSPYLIFD
ncbi:hypothetical protein EJ08DRAFT_456013 [Tothia fuscella]|uniref:Leucine-rich repeat domain-containing protein n=1 Tax=Tothia fuscella TaxID=1048955 RepID=A0A9P4TTP8_9PEZI|nr:hypothetical protein EJ08DRAFT_456013 [Tothia fuscella]